MNVDSLIKGRCHFQKAKGKMQHSKADELYNEYWSLEDRKRETLEELSKINKRLEQLKPLFSVTE